MMRSTWTQDPTGRTFPETIKWLLIVNGVVFLLQNLLAVPVFQTFGLRLEEILGLRPAWVVERLWVWQLLTYMFLHGGFFHLLFNMFVLWMFGTQIERLWGPTRFLHYYVVCGLGAAALSFVFNYNSIIIGASGAVLGVLLAFGMLFPNQYIYLWLSIWSRVWRDSSCCTCSPGRRAASRGLLTWAGCWPVTCL
jgi:membrane associated rhomboid family serine protease